MQSHNFAWRCSRSPWLWAATVLLTTAFVAGSADQAGVASTYGQILVGEDGCTYTFTGKIRTKFGAYMAHLSNHDKGGAPDGSLQWPLQPWL